MQAELNCLKDLLNSGRNWSYALDMAGSEVMLLTNREMVANLDSQAEKIYTASFPLPQNNMFRIEFHLPVPFNLTVFKAQ